MRQVSREYHEAVSGLYQALTNASDLAIRNAGCPALMRGRVIMLANGSECYRLSTLITVVLAMPVMRAISLTPTPAADAARIRSSRWR